MFSISRFIHLNGVLNYSGYFYFSEFYFCCILLYMEAFLHEAAAEFTYSYIKILWDQVGRIRSRRSCNNNATAIVKCTFSRRYRIYRSLLKYIELMERSI